MEFQPRSIVRRPSRLLTAVALLGASVLPQSVRAAPEEPTLTASSECVGPHVRVHLALEIKGSLILEPGSALILGVTQQPNGPSDKWEVLGNASKDSGLEVTDVFEISLNTATLTYDPVKRFSGGAEYSFIISKRIASPDGKEGLLNIASTSERMVTCSQE